MIIWIGLAGMLGAVLRYSLGRWISGSLGTAFPWGTWVINISGSLLLGLLYGWHQSASISDGIWVIGGLDFAERIPHSLHLDMRPSVCWGRNVTQEQLYTSSVRYCWGLRLLLQACGWLHK
ncbi:fluoride efflux transporter FluC [Paenibacillus sp. 1A_MP2]|uniref:fluoride efflux transporter FluC n=1 Tax=Paenibacillus sp. 1A_MP2 TaxID=3457495 RepID=UPI003FCDEA7F